VFATLLEARSLIERWRSGTNTVGPVAACGYRPPSPEQSARNAGPSELAPAPGVLWPERVGITNHSGGNQPSGAGSQPDFLTDGVARSTPVRPLGKAFGAV